MVQVYQVNNSVTFGGKAMGSKEFLIQMVDALDIIIERPRKRES